MLVEALDTFAEILQKIAPAHNLAKDWEAPLGTASQTLTLFQAIGYFACRPFAKAAGKFQDHVRLHQKTPEMP